jgi:hypothetical protein
MTVIALTFISRRRRSLRGEFRAVTPASNMGLLLHQALKLGRCSMN